MSIKNVVFDCGQVLVHFEPSYMVGVYVSDKDDKALLEKVVFDRLYWDKLDLGTITNEETVNEIKKRIPERLWDVSEKIYYNWIYNIPEIEGMKELIKRIKERHGVKVFLLSNISKYFAAHINELEILNGFDGLVMSSEIGIVKPSVQIYEYLCKTYSLDPSQTVFIDDRLENIQGAKNYGIHGYLFDGNVKKLESYLEEIL